MGKKCIFHYDDLSDRLFVSRKEDSDIIDGSVRILNVIIDVTINNKIANIELLETSQYLQSLGINPAVLSKLTDVGLSFRTIRNGYEIIFILKVGKKVIPVSYNIQMSPNRQIMINQS